MPLFKIVEDDDECCRELRFIETKPKILNKKGFVLSVTNAHIFACPNRAPIPSVDTCGSQSPRADEIGLREVTLALPPWKVESEKGLRASQVFGLWRICFQVGTD